MAWDINPILSPEGRWIWYSCHFPSDQYHKPFSVRTRKAKCFDIHVILRLHWKWIWSGQMYPIFRQGGELHQHHKSFSVERQNALIWILFRFLTENEYEVTKSYPIAPRSLSGWQTWRPAWVSTASEWHCRGCFFWNVVYQKENTWHQGMQWNIQRIVELLSPRHNSQCLAM